ncbi:hypothetical protein [Chryseobacterium sp. MEBOG07]|uniref:hypothetical protein n=1 Tax=Chryseobacterium sp. MEBOG07 TaxID=2879939 RepID=UPI001F487327|nr:hypothetical protein [Chryseobacterium sp. MEBOG07]UKB78467.1 hypothetical protein LF886_18610 [Chryseobacterium sp. MEBOG07]
MNDAMLNDKIEKNISENHRNILLSNFFGEEEYDVYHKIMFKAEVSAGSNITYVVDNGDGATNESTFEGNIWISPEYIHTEELSVGEVINHIKNATVKAIGFNESSTLKVQIYVDGVLKKEEVCTGKNLEVTAKYNIKFK